MDCGLTMIHVDWCEVCRPRHPFCCVFYSWPHSILEYSGAWLMGSTWETPKVDGWKEDLFLQKKRPKRPSDLDHSQFIMDLNFAWAHPPWGPHPGEGCCWIRWPGLSDPYMGENQNRGDVVVTVVLKLTKWTYIYIYKQSKSKKFSDPGASEISWDMTLMWVLGTEMGREIKQHLLEAEDFWVTGGFPEIGVPLVIIHFHGIFRCKPSILDFLIGIFD